MIFYSHQKIFRQRPWAAFSYRNFLLGLERCEFIPFFIKLPELIIGSVKGMPGAEINKLFVGLFNFKNVRDRKFLLVVFVPGKQEALYFRHIEKYNRGHPQGLMKKARGLPGLERSK